MFRNYKDMKAILIPLVIIAIASLTILVGCEIDSVDSVTRGVDFDAAGLYYNVQADGSISPEPMVSQNSGDPVVTFSVRQFGGELEVIDNNGSIYRGDIDQVTSAASGSTASVVALFTLAGHNTAGAAVTIVGQFSNEGTKSIHGDWIENTLLGIVSGQASGPLQSLALSETVVSLGIAGTNSFIATGGTGRYTWDVDNSSIGYFEALSGPGNNTAIYRASGSGNNIVYVRSGGQEVQATVSQASDLLLDTSLVTLNPSSSSANSYTFTASGGDGSYTWSVNDTSIGDISTLTGSGNASATYTATATGENTLTVSSAGFTASATIIQSSTDLAISPTYVTMDTSNTNLTQTFTATGGDGSYVWNMTVSSFGYFVSRSGNTATYKPLTNGVNTITVTSDGDTVNATIDQQDL